MNPEQRQEAIFGSFDGVVSIIGFVFGLLVHKSAESAIAIGGLGGAISASISMGTGEYEKGDGPWHERLKVATAMFLATAIGSLVPIWPFFVFSKTVAVMIAAIGCLIVAGWIGHEKRKGVSGYLAAYVSLLAAAGLTLAVIAAIPNSVG